MHESASIPRGLIDPRRGGAYRKAMTIELTQEQERVVRGLVEAGQYESVEHFIDEAITEAYTRTEVFANWARAKLDASQKDIEAGRVITVPKGKIGETLDELRRGTLEFER